MKSIWLLRTSGTIVRPNCNLEKSNVTGFYLSKTRKEKNTEFVRPNCNLEKSNVTGFYLTPKHEKKKKIQSLR